jgi:DNA-binding NarL/FixJ family response regulator
MDTYGFCRPVNGPIGSETMTSCLIVEDHDLMAEGIMQAALGAGLGPIRRAATLHDAFAGDPAEVVLLDLSLPDSCRLDTADAVIARWPASRVLVLSADVDLDHALMLLRSGVSGVIGKEVTVESLRGYVETIISGGFAISADVAKVISAIDDVPEPLVRVLSHVSLEHSFDESAATCGLSRFEAGTLLREVLLGSNIPSLTAAQLRVLLFVEAGYSNKAAAQALGVGIKMIERHIRDVRRRMRLPEREPRQMGAFAQRLHRGCLLSLEDHLSTSNDVDSSQPLELATTPRDPQLEDAQLAGIDDPLREL